MFLWLMMNELSCGCWRREGFKKELKSPESWLTPPSLTRPSKHLPTVRLFLFQTLFFSQWKQFCNNTSCSGLSDAGMFKQIPSHLAWTGTGSHDSATSLSLMADWNWLFTLYDACTSFIGFVEHLDPNIPLIFISIQLLWQFNNLTVCLCVKWPK